MNCCRCLHRFLLASCKLFPASLFRIILRSRRGRRPPNHHGLNSRRLACRTWTAGIRVKSVSLLRLRIGPTAKVVFVARRSGLRIETIDLMCFWISSTGAGLAITSCDVRSNQLTRLLSRSYRSVTGRNRIHELIAGRRRGGESSGNSGFLYFGLSCFRSLVTAIRKGHQKEKSKNADRPRSPLAHSSRLRRLRI